MSTSKKGKLIVTGGMGYIGSHTIVDLIQHGYEVISVDSLVNSTEQVIDGIEKICGIRIKNYQIDLSKQDSWKEIAAKEKDISGIIHFAAFKAVGESVKQSLEYYQNNLGSLFTVLEWMKQAQIPNLIFSSSCTVYGDTKIIPVKEDTPFGECSSPYGRTKQMGEFIIRDFSENHPVKIISLRYFNPAGAHESNHIGESASQTALNLVPVLTETAIGKREEMIVFGNDYPTADGSCVRDYIHVMDIAHAHTLAMDLLINKSDANYFDAFNLGMRKGLSVFDVINHFESVNNVKVNWKIGPKREGDMAEIYADTQKASDILHWIPSRNIADIMITAWAWEQKRSGKK